jgi:hypothetical protein
MQSTLVVQHVSVSINRSPEDVYRFASNVRGRDAHYCAPPAQIRASAIHALGSHLGCLTSKRCVGHG